MNPEAEQKCYAATYLEDFADAEESLPPSIQLRVSRMLQKQIKQEHYAHDIQFQTNILLKMMEEENPCEVQYKATSSKLEKLLMESQTLADERMQISQEIKDLVDNKLAQLNLDGKNYDNSFARDDDEDDDGVPRPNGHRIRPRIYVPTGRNVASSSGTSNLSTPISSPAPTNSKAVPALPAAAATVVVVTKPKPKPAAHTANYQSVLDKAVGIIRRKCRSANTNKPIQTITKRYTKPRLLKPKIAFSFPNKSNQNSPQNKPVRTTSVIKHTSSAAASSSHETKPANSAKPRRGRPPFSVKAPTSASDLTSSPEPELSQSLDMGTCKQPGSGQAIHPKIGSEEGSPGAAKKEPSPPTLSPIPGSSCGSLQTPGSGPPKLKSKWANAAKLLAKRNSKEDMANKPGPKKKRTSGKSGAEPTYCSCNDVFYGQMVGCDNGLCPIQWFHFPCVSLKIKPKGEWYCPDCRGEDSTVGKPVLVKSNA